MQVNTVMMIRVKIKLLLPLERNGSVILYLLKLFIALLAGFNGGMYAETILNSFGLEIFVTLKSVSIGTLRKTHHHGKTYHHVDTLLLKVNLLSAETSEDVLYFS